MIEVKRLKPMPCKQETGSLIELLHLPRTQSLMSKLGFAMERAFNKCLRRIDGLVVLQSSHDIAIYGHQLDLLFKYKNVIYYFELKANLNLDTEKTIAVKKKIIKVEQMLKKQYPEKAVVSAVLSARYASKCDVGFMKLPLHTSDVYGYGEFFRIFSNEVTEQRWKLLFRRIGKQLESCI